MSNGAGHIQDMINRPKNNHPSSSKSTRETLKFKSISEEERHILLKNFNINNRTIRLFEKVLLGITFIIFVCIIVWLFL